MFSRDFLEQSGHTSLQAAWDAARAVPLPWLCGVRVLPGTFAPGPSRVRGQTGRGHRDHGTVPVPVPAELQLCLLHC